MTTIHSWMNNRWSIPAASGALILAALVLLQIGRTDTAGNILMVAAAVVAGTHIVIAAARALWARVIGIDLLVAVAAIGAVIIGQYWEAAAVTFLFAIGHALETATLNKTRSALAELVAVAPDIAITLRDGEQVEVAATAVIQGETVLIKNGAKVPVDGEVIGGAGALDEASITGESMPVEKATGDRVFAGTVARSGFLQVRATGVGTDTTLARIIHRVEDAQDAKAKTQVFMDRFSAWYTPAILILAIIVGLFTQNIVLALTLLVIGCPGALVISIPVSIVAGIGRAAKDGILIKGGEFLETSARITAVAVDKTGTLTLGRPRVTDVVVLNPALTRGEVLGWAGRAEVGSEHPLSRAILDAARTESLDVAGLPESTSPVPGKGIVVTARGHRVLIGNPALLAQYAIIDSDAATHAATALAEAGRTPMIVMLDDTVAGVIGVADEVRTDAAQMVSDLHAAGVKRVIMLTGDAPLVAHAVAAVTGVDEVHASLLPEDKLDVVTSLQAEGYVVAMVGDGVNDAPALATADIGVAMGAAGSAVAVETADIALMGDNLLKLPEAISLARRTVNNMRQNIAIALITVTLLLLGVLLGGVTMSIGMLVHEASVLIVIVNAMRLLRRHDQHRPAEASRPTSLPPSTGPEPIGITIRPDQTVTSTGENHVLVD
ncbi:cation-translocating P-type ATPase [Cryobacterium sp. PAMC25264]|uniref:heavy metal translocating P-type ATPase n=1 Tax=Cryobacterium sp. PAMC25264 TaxID=2861288 RepID=UPI001C632DAB|nr:cation-translocating P-type ATPase [Cryobacterium sp. PAMC25264]QYF75209.1 cation-translocating P-type ATPase [Cryobacterium sp. PAMC25264]